MKLENIDMPIGMNNLDKAIITIFKVGIPKVKVESYCKYGRFQNRISISLIAFSWRILIIKHSSSLLPQRKKVENNLSLHQSCPTLPSLTVSM